MSSIAFGVIKFVVPPPVVTIFKIIVPWSFIMGPIGLEGVRAWLSGSITPRIQCLIMYWRKIVVLVNTVTIHAIFGKKLRLITDARSDMASHIGH